MNQEFAALKESAQQQHAIILDRVREINDDVGNLLERNGAVYEYVSERDHLYITIGQPREGMALFAGKWVLIADPVTLELIGIEIPDFQQEISSGTLSGLEQVAAFLAFQPILQIPPTERENPDNLSDTVGRVVRRELVAV